MDFSTMFQAGANTGALSGDQFDGIAQLYKALEAGYGTDVATLQGGGALRIQSLEHTMLATIQENQHFKLFNALQKTNATATVDEWTEQSGIGGFLGGSTNTETGTISAAQGKYARRTGLVKYLMTRREVSLVTTLQGAIADAEAIEYSNGALQLLTDAEYLSLEGNSAVVPTEFDGLDALIRANAPADHVIDVAGGTLDNITYINQASAIIAGYGNFGVPTDLFCSQRVQSDFDNYLDPAFRVALANVPNGGVSIGAPVVGIRTSHGNVANQCDVFVRDEDLKAPFETLSNEHAAMAAANTFASVGVAGVAGANANSKFAAAHAGNYYYAVTGVNAKGQSVVTKSAQVAVASGDGVTLTIQPSAGGTETGYVIYRSKRNGTNTTADFREMIRVAKAGAGNTTYVDLNTELPGSSKAFLLNLTPGHMALTWRQLLPMMKFPLYPTAAAVIPWAQLLFGYMRMGKAKHHVEFKNIVPNSASWKPF